MVYFSHGSPNVSLSQQQLKAALFSALDQLGEKGVVRLVMADGWRMVKGTISVLAKASQA